MSYYIGFLAVKQGELFLLLLLILRSVRLDGMPRMMRRPCYFSCYGAQHLYRLIPSCLRAAYRQRLVQAAAEAGRF